jgi:S-DNA-T family DNA segregation ATPase FtsK/SpoIIIE
MNDSQGDDIIIERIKADNGTKTDNPTNSKKRKPKAASKTKKTNTKSAKKSSSKSGSATHLKLTGALLGFILIMILLSVVSYSRADQMNVNFPIGEIFGMFSPDSVISAKAEMTENWLGLLGAKISDFVINKMFGLVGILGIIILFLPSRDLLFDGKVREKTIHRLITFGIISIAFSIMMGAWTLAFPGLGTEWSGLIGFFIADSVSNLIGTAGIIIASSLGFLALILLNLDIDWNRLLNRSGAVAGSAAERTGSVLKNWIDKSRSSIENKVSDYKESKHKNSGIEEIEETESSKAENSSDVDIDTPNIVINQRKEEQEDTKHNLEIHRHDTAISHLLDDDLEDEIEIVSAKNGINTSSQAGITEREDKDLEYLENSGNTSNTVESLHLETEIKSDDIDGLTGELENLLSSLPDKSENHNQDNIEVDLPAGHKDPLKVTVVEKEGPEYDEPLSTAIHDKDISFEFPGLKLLNKDTGINKVDDAELKMNARILEEKLETFRITIKNLEVTPGPVVTQYEFVPGDGIKVSRIESLSDDLAMALKARGIRIIAPIPGKGTVGVEIPNNNPSLVTFSSVIATKAFKDCDYILPIAFGKDISGDIYMLDLAKMPHLLIAGSTGSGKSVGVNGLIASLLYKKHPSELKFVIIDPKQVEMTQYSALKNHYMAASPDVRDTIVTDPDDAKLILNSTVEEMENRYTILAKVGQKNIEDYNNKVRQGKLKDRTDMVHREMPYIVVIIDEFADLIMTAGKEVETPIVRLAQKARAIGIHIVLATQRPSVNVITGLIKANFPARVSYMVASKIDSRTILDGPGADKLLGRGDALVLPPGKPKPDRVQNCFVSTDEIDNICDHISEQSGYNMPYMLPSVVEESDPTDMIDPKDRDPLFMEAASLLLSAGKASTSMFQRQLRIGYARAGRMMDELESAGVVGPANGSKPRDVLIHSLEDIV